MSRLMWLTSTKGLKDFAESHGGGGSSNSGTINSWFGQEGKNLSSSGLCNKDFDVLWPSKIGCDYSTGLGT